MTDADQMRSITKLASIARQRRAQEAAAESEAQRQRTQAEIEAKAQEELPHFLAQIRKAADEAQSEWSWHKDSPFPEQGKVNEAFARIMSGLLLVRGFTVQVSSTEDTDDTGTHYAVTLRVSW